jgi:aspartyl-tRNA(Asn)/glutamyl-tRNA(Gln) amidotransferase subunit C
VLQLFLELGRGNSRLGAIFMYNAQMTHQVDIRSLANLARLEVTDEEVARLEKELPGILSFVEEIQKASAEVPHKEPVLKNVLREDKDPHESGLYSKKLLDAAPASERDHVVVKQVLRQK